MKEVEAFKQGLHSSEMLEEEKARIKSYLSKFSLKLNEFPLDQQITPLHETLIRKRFLKKNNPSLLINPL